MSQNGRALISALNNGDYDAVDRNPLSDTDIKIVNHHVHEVFERAIGGENLPLFDALLRIPHIKISSKEYCALRHCCQLGLIEYAQRLEGHAGVNAKLKDKLGFTALTYALTGNWSESKCLDLLKILLDFPSLKVNSKTKEKKTALHYAIQKDWFEAAELLLNKGANPQIEDAEGSTPLNLGMLKDMPPTLFGAMLSYTGGPDEEADEEEEEILADGSGSQEDVYKRMNAHKPPDFSIPDQQVDLSDPAPLSQSSPNPRPVQPVSQIMPPVKPDPVAAPPPQVRHTDVAVSEPVRPKPERSVEKVKPHTPARKNAFNRGSTEPIVIDDDGDFLEIMGVESLEELKPGINRNFLLQRSEFDPRFRLHRRAVIDKLPELNAILVAKDQGLRPEDFNQKDPITGFTFWHVAAATDQFENALKMLAEQGHWPKPEDFAQTTEVGKTITDVLEDMNRLSGILHSDVWNQKPHLLASLLAQLTDTRKKQFGNLISRTNLKILHY